MEERIIILELYKILSIVNGSIGSCHLIRIEYKEVSIHWFSSSCSSEDVRFLVLNDKVDKREGLETFFSVIVLCMEGKGFK
jgi:hypothetical protein